MEIVSKVLASERRGEPCDPPLSESISISCLSLNMESMGFSLHYLGGFFGCKRMRPEIRKKVPQEISPYSP
jgi:hypothetical protein